VLFLANATNTTFAVNNGSLPFSINDSRSRQPIAGATACIQVGTWCATTDIHGQGVIDSIEPGLYSITVSASGYDTVIEPNFKSVNYRPYKNYGDWA
jgi:hypothetical protein